MTTSDIQDFKDWIRRTQINAIAFPGCDCAHLALKLLITYAKDHQLPVYLKGKGGQYYDSTNTIYKDNWLGFIDGPNGVINLQADDLWYYNTKEKGVLPADFNKANSGDLMMGLKAGNGFTGHTKIIRKVFRIQFTGNPGEDYWVHYAQAHRDHSVELLSEIGEDAIDRELTTTSLREWLPAVFGRKTP